MYTFTLGQDEYDTLMRAIGSNAVVDAVILEPSDVETIVGMALMISNEGMHIDGSVLDLLEKLLPHMDPIDKEGALYIMGRADEARG